MSDSGRTVVIAGGSGFLGYSLAQSLHAAGYKVCVLARRQVAAVPWRIALWDGCTVGAWADELAASDVVVNLAGRSVDCIKSPDHCDEILRSRIMSTRILGETCRKLNHVPRVWVQMSTAHIYGDPPTTRCEEGSPTGWGLAPDVGRAWEAEYSCAKPERTRGVVLRTSFVVGRSNPGGAGALGKLGLLARLGLGGRVGSGTQGMSWLHAADMNRIVERAIVDERMNGVYIASAPQPVSQFEFMRELRRAAGGLGKLGMSLPAFEWMVRLGAPLILRTDPELALYGRYVLPKRLLTEGFEFRYPTVEAALSAIYGGEHKGPVPKK